MFPLSQDHSQVATSQHQDEEKDQLGDTETVQNIPAQEEYYTGFEQDSTSGSGAPQFSPTRVDTGERVPPACEAEEQAMHAASEKPFISEEYDYSASTSSQRFENTDYGAPQEPQYAESSLEEVFEREVPQEPVSIETATGEPTVCKEQDEPFEPFIRKESFESDMKPEDLRAPHVAMHADMQEDLIEAETSKFELAEADVSQFDPLDTSGQEEVSEEQFARINTAFVPEEPVETDEQEPIPTACGVEPSKLVQDELTEPPFEPAGAIQEPSESGVPLFEPVDDRVQGETADVVDVPLEQDLLAGQIESPASAGGHQHEPLEYSHAISSEVSEEQYPAEHTKPTESTLDAKDRLKSSSYEDIYVGIKGPLDDEDDLVMPMGAPIEVGDRFESRHMDPQFVDGGAKSSSFENLYEASKKEEGDVEEKDIDEREVESDPERPEKGFGEDEKEGSCRDNKSPPPYPSTSLSREEADAPSRSPVAKHPSPIDVTLESGLDQVGQDEKHVQFLIDSPSRNTLEHSVSYDPSQGELLQDEDDSSSESRQRHFSSPDDTLLHQQGTTTMTPNEDMERDKEGEESQLVSAEGELDEAAGGELQTTRLVLKKQVHKKTVIRDGKEETIVTEDTHVEQDNEGPDELREDMQRVVDDFMDGKDLDAE